MNGKILQVQQLDTDGLRAILKEIVKDGVNESKEAIVVQIHKLPKKINREVFCALTGFSEQTFNNHIELGYLKCTLRSTKGKRIMRDVTREDFVKYYIHYIKDAK